MRISLKLEPQSGILKIPIHYNHILSSRHLSTGVSTGHLPTGFMRRATGMKNAGLNYSLFPA